MLAARKPRERKAAQEQAETEEEEDLDGKETNAVFLNGGVSGYPKSCQIGRIETHGFGITYLKKSTNIVLRCFANCQTNVVFASEWVRTVA